MLFASPVADATPRGAGAHTPAITRPRPEGAAVCACGAAAASPQWEGVRTHTGVRASDVGEPADVAAAHELKALGGADEESGWRWIMAWSRAEPIRRQS